MEWTRSGFSTGAIRRYGGKLHVTNTRRDGFGRREKAQTGGAGFKQKQSHRIAVAATVSSYVPERDRDGLYKFPGRQAWSFGCGQPESYGCGTPDGCFVDGQTRPDVLVRHQSRT